MVNKSTCMYMFFSGLREITLVQNHLECVLIGSDLFLCTTFHVDRQITEAVTLCLVKA